MFSPQTQGLLRYYMVFLLFAFFQQNSRFSPNLTKNKEINGVLCENGFFDKNTEIHAVLSFLHKKSRKNKGVVHVFSQNSSNLTTLYKFLGLAIVGWGFNAFLLFYRIWKF